MRKAEKQNAKEIQRAVNTVKESGRVRNKLLSSFTPAGGGVGAHMFVQTFDPKDISLIKCTSEQCRTSPRNAPACGQSTPQGDV